MLPENFIQLLEFMGCRLLPNGAANKKDWPTFTGVQKNKKITRCDARNSEEHFN